METGDKDTNSEHVDIKERHTEAQSQAYITYGKEKRNIEVSK